MSAAEMTHTHNPPRHVRHYGVLIVGGGNSGAQAAARLREAGYAGTIALVSAEQDSPYERPPLSKGFMTGEKTETELRLRPESYWDEATIDLYLGRRIISVAAEEHTAATDDGTTFGYTKLIWAAGGEPRRLTLPGSDLDGVFSLRTLEEAKTLQAAMRSATHAVIIGGGYIGLEAAATFRKAGITVMVLEAQSRLLQRVTGPEISDFFLARHRHEGVDVRLNVSVQELIGRDGKITAVALDSGEEVPADFVLVGIGLVPNSEVLARAGAACSNGLDIDDRCRTSLTDIYAIGDVANYASPFSATGSRVRLESVPNSSEHARTVAADISGSTIPAPTVPWFWSSQYDVKLQTAGLILGYDQTIVRGDARGTKFSVAYLKEGHIIGIDAINSVKDFVQAKQLIATNAALNPATASDVDSPLLASAVEPEQVGV
jgi:3-phenylpropionate/trans-cinnamate dioxygenase ferredoxin reductase subunit